MTRGAASSSVARKRRKKSARERFCEWTDEVGVRGVARLLGVDPAHVSRVKNGKKKVSGALGAKIQRLRGIPSVDWFEGS